MSGPRAIGVLASILLPIAIYAMEPEIVEFRAEYDGYVGKIPVGTARLSVQRQADGLYTVDSELVPGDILALLDAERSLERSRVRMQGNEIETLETKITKQRRTRIGHISVTFDWANGMAMVEDDAGTTQIPLERPMYDPASLLLAIIHDANRGRFARHYTALDGRKVKRYSVSSIGGENVDTDFGELSTQRVERFRDGSDRSMIFWLAPEMKYLPVRIVTTRDGEQQLRLELRVVEGIEISAR